ncbi:MAG TPA: hypothetical protein VFI46_05600 [Jiangellaceae bacterium]|nr:hypothetical protein [Jiangellaceae bacterium]
MTTLDRFAQTIADGDLSRLLDRLRSRPSDADACLYQYANALNGYADTQIAWLAFGPKLWLATNGVGLAWRPLPARTTSLTRTVASGTRRGQVEDAPARLLLLLLVGSGLTAEEAVRLRLGDLGHVDEDCALVPDLFAEPLGVRYSPTKPRQFPETGMALTFLGFEAREALQADLVRRAAAGEPTNAETPILGLVDVEAVMERARSRHSALIEAGNDVNVASCRATGDFFRQWGMPGAAFDPARSRPSVN